MRSTGHMALALQSRGLTVSIQTGNLEKGPLHSLDHQINIHHVKKPKVTFPWQNLFAKELYKTLSNDKTIDLVHFMDIPPHFHQLEQVCHTHGIPTTAATTQTEAFNLKKTPLLHRKAYLNALDRLNRIILPNSFILEQASQVHLDNLTLIPLGVQVDRFKPVLSKRPLRRELGLPESATIACCMADFEPDNRQLDLLHLCMPLGELLYLLVIGHPKDMLYLERLRAEAQTLGVEPYLMIKDAVDNPEDYLKASDVFMLLGGIEERQETILEAQSCGLPVVLTPTENALNLTNGNKTGIVLYPNNSLAKQGVEKLLSDPNFRQGRSVHARPFIKKNHGFRDVMDVYYQLFKNI